MRGAFHLLALMSLAWFGQAAFGQENRIELAKKAKAATALVEVAGGFKHGSAFCVHESGLFLTNQHVVRGALEVKLILHPGLPNQQIVKARVIRRSEAADLAILRIVEKTALTVLALGSSDNLVELTEVVAAGFPFGKSLAAKGEYPAVSVNQGRVTSLRLKKGVLDRIQLDAVLNPGNSGGPVLDMNGKVVGVVVSGVLGTSVNFAIPVSHVHAFVAMPELEPDFPSIAFADRFKPALFQAKTIFLTPTKDEYTAELMIGGRTFPMTREGNIYRATAEALKPLPGPRSLRVTLTYARGSVQGELLDQAFSVGKETIKLSDVRSLRFGKESAVLANGKIATGAFSGLDAVIVNVGGDSIKLNPGRALELSVHPDKEELSVACAIVIRKDQKEIARAEQTIAFRDVPVPPVLESGSGVIPIAIAPPVLERDSTTINLPSTFAEVAVGGNGRFIVLHFPKLRSLGIFDVTLGKIVHTLPLADDVVRIAAGMDKLVVAYPKTKLLQRYSLTSFERELVKPIELKGNLHCLAIGSASQGPIFLGGSQGPGGGTNVGVTFLDMDFNPLPVAISGQLTIGYAGEPMPVRASANGRVFTGFGVGSSGYLQALVVDGLQANLYASGGQMGSVMPGHDGLTLFASHGGLYTWQAKLIEGTDKGPQRCSVPAHGFPYHVSFRTSDPTRGPKDKGITIHITGDSRVIAALPHVDEHRGFDQFGRAPLSPDKRIHFIPDAQVIVSLPEPNDKLLLHRFDMDATLQKGNFDFLFLTSSPPLSAPRGKVWNYTVAAKSKRGGVTCKLINGPAEMVVTPTGDVTWPVPESATAGEVDVLIAVSDLSKQEIFHSFKIRVR